MGVENIFDGECHVWAWHFICLNVLILVHQACIRGPTQAVHADIWR
uniref:Uncharacterized protein n=1 Tax=Rhizophora mucronata TaxID=61149 RepID=A0A2P2Q791_RHIMU